MLPFGKFIYQSDEGQGITSDTAAVIDHIQNKSFQKNISALELGCGNGIISIMLAHYHSSWHLSGLDIQKDLIQLAKRNAKLTETNINFFHSDLRSYKSSKQFDLIISNPPYFPVGKGKISSVKERAISRHELECTISDVLAAIERNLKKEGTAFLIYPLFRWKEFTLSLKKVDLILTEKNIFSSFEGEKKRVILELKYA